MVTIKHIANLLDFNISTVSRALNNDPRVKESTKKKVNELAKKLGYKPNLAARYLVQGKTKTIWFIVPVIFDLVEIQTPQFASQILAKKDYDLVVAIHHNDPAIYERLLNRLKQGVADGAIILLACDSKKDPIVDELIEQNYPIVFLDRYNEDLNTTIVTTDNYKASKELVQLCYNDSARFFIPLFGKKYINVVENERLAGAVDKFKELSVDFTLNFESLTEEELLNLPENIALMSSTTDGILKFYERHKKYLENKNLFFAVFDMWESKLSIAKSIYVCEQDLELVSKIGVQKILEKIEKKAPNKKEFISVPAKKFEKVSV